MQRLVVCLDGTWNKQDSGTNVLHHFAMALENGIDQTNGRPGSRQTRYYHKGVGTGALDSITGGGFGFGLEENVRDAYNWLVANYHDGVSPEEADEIYIFGFSRGAYTARSLVGFIASCGLLRRGAPVSVSQLWDDYCILGRQYEKRRSFWDRFFAESPTDIRRITDLVCDPWQIDKYEAARMAGQAALGGVKPTDEEPREPGQRAAKLNLAERLLVRWSRRVRITYLGIYDTVGAIGIDALAIPGLRSKLAMHHNMRATTLIQRCRHALAADEHRSSFNRTPLVAFVQHALQGKINQDSDVPAAGRQMGDELMTFDDMQSYWHQQKAMWRRKIEQRWFIGAHSNVGGGYPDNELAQLPLKWLLDGATRAGLESEPFEYIPPVPVPPPRDSYAEFAKPFWTQIIRGKRFYRPIDPEPERRAALNNKDHHQPLTPSYSLHTINEQVDDSVLENASTGASYQPLNVIEYARRKLNDPLWIKKQQQRLRSLAEKIPTFNAEGAWKRLEKSLADIDALPPAAHTWLGGRIYNYLIVILWGTFASFGLETLNTVFCLRVEVFPKWVDVVPLPYWLLYSVAFALVLIDWGESRLNHSLALHGRHARHQALLDTLYWLRTLGFVFFVCGVVTTLVHLWALGWGADDVKGAWGETMDVIQRWWKVPVAAAAGVLVANGMDRAPKDRQLAGLWGALVGILAPPVIVGLVIGLGRLFGQVFTPVFGHGHPEHAGLTQAPHLVGLLLLLELACGCFLNSLAWVREPMATAQLDSIVRLQRCGSAARVKTCLDRWCTALVYPWDDEDDKDQHVSAARTLARILRETLWRDMFGYIPLYLVTFGFGLWFAEHGLHWPWLSANFLGVPLWPMLPLLAAVADYGEDVCHLCYVRRYTANKPIPGWLPPVSFGMSLVKFGAWFSSLTLCAMALVGGSWQVADLEETSGWRGTVSLLIAAMVVLAFAVLVLSVPIYHWRTSKRRALTASS